jgi:hypothetical protein
LAVGAAVGAGQRRMTAPRILIRYLDVALVVIGAPVAIVLGAPALGYAIGGVAWIAQRILGETDKRWTARMSDPRRQLAFNLFEGFGRIWLLAGAIVIAGVAVGRPDGLTAALVIFGAYSIAFLIKVATGPPNKRSAPQ